MKIFSLDSDSNLQWVSPADEQDAQNLIKLRANLSNWKPNKTIPIRQIEWYHGKFKPLNVDSPHFNYLGPICLSMYARQALSSILINAGFFCDTDLDWHGLYSLFFPTIVLDALDQERSELTRFEDGAVWEVVRYELRPKILRNHSIFKMRHRPSFVFVSEDFVRLTIECNLVGFIFTEIWNSESGGIQGAGQNKFPNLDELSNVYQKRRVREKRAEAAKIVSYRFRT